MVEADLEKKFFSLSYANQEKIESTNECCGWSNGGDIYSTGNCEYTDSCEHVVGKRINVSMDAVTYASCAHFLLQVISRFGLSVLFFGLSD
jgi:hypothetical protein